MKFKIYQIDMDRDKNRVKFDNLENTKKHQGFEQIDAGIYNRVFMGDTDSETLEDIYRLFNTEKHRLHRGHSLSVSDIVSTDDGSFFCDSVGFQKVDFDESAAHVPDNLIRILVIEPHRTPYESEIPNTPDGQQRAVEGLIQYLENGDGTVIVINEESKLNGMEGNRRIEGDVLVGPIFIAGITEDGICSLTDEQMQKYAQKFAEPEEIPPEEIEQHTGFFFQRWY